MTTLPIRNPVGLSPKGLGRAAGWFPIVGLVLGAALMATWFLARLWFPDMLTGALVTLAWVALTGGLHLDGLADACDGLLATEAPSRRLEILHDVRVGAFGAIGVALLLLLKAAAVGALIDPLPLLLAPILGRWSLLLGGVFSPARPAGLGADFRSGLTRRGLAAAALVTALAAGLLGWRGLLAFAVAHAVVFALFRAARVRLGGVTGDVLGAACELAELSVLLASAAKLQA
ncbi:MAG: adenosylcobinamide-GDP ribazoletransferase [Chloroflexi bacterium]|nr:adenosylcobinamide-GDP ribazoletransferase [Chloroflexota bacterium]